MTSVQSTLISMALDWVSGSQPGGIAALEYAYVRKAAKT
jgi:hypothetical protein